MNTITMVKSTDWRSYKDWKSSFSFGTFGKIEFLLKDNFTIVNEKTNENRFDIDKFRWIGTKEQIESVEKEGNDKILLRVSKLINDKIIEIMKDNCRLFQGSILVRNNLTFVLLDGGIDIKIIDNQFVFLNDGIVQKIGCLWATNEEILEAIGF